MSVAEISASPPRSVESGPGSGLTPRLQATPSQCTNCERLSNGWPVSYLSMAQISFGPITAISPSQFPEEPTLGVGTMFHEVPSQCIARVEAAPLLLPVAHTSLADSAATLLSQKYIGPVPGLGTTFHTAPFQWMVSACQKP